MICDFTKLKPFVEQVKDMFDHKTLVYDPDIIKPDMSDPAITKVNYNPTAENMADDIARALLHYITTDLKISVKGVSVSVNETQNNKAVVEIKVG
jgi:6-pyruvoyl-tetrahydropterin synthase